MYTSPFGAPVLVFMPLDVAPAPAKLDTTEISMSAATVDTLTTCGGWTLAPMVAVCEDRTGMSA